MKIKSPPGTIYKGKVGSVPIFVISVSRKKKQYNTSSFSAISLAKFGTRSHMIITLPLPGMGSPFLTVFPIGHPTSTSTIFYLLWLIGSYGWLGTN
jgi:hypothetical protein